MRFLQVIGHLLMSFFWLCGCALAGEIASHAERISGRDTSNLPWAFRVPVSHVVPHVDNRAWPVKPLDYFVLAALEQRKLHPVRQASRSEWLRRATFDLTGLPPTPAECARFESDTSPDAYARIVDRLLDSPHYGERWGRYWLDIARYADDQGNSFLTPTPAAYLYRDWVVKSLNEDMPYDEFVRLQIAGDEISSPASDYFVRLAGLGFQGLGPQFRKGAAGEAKAKADELEDRLDTLSRGILGLTVSCARCHDHKFDPISTREYYSLAAAYNGAEWPGRMLASPRIVEAHRKWADELEQKKAGIRKWLEEQSLEAGRKGLLKTATYVTAAAKVMVLRQNKLPLDEAAFARQEGLELLFLRRWATVLDQPGDESVFQGVRDALKQAKPLASVVTSQALHQQARALDALVQAAGKVSNDTETTGVDRRKVPQAMSKDQEKLLSILWKDSKAPFFVPEKDRESLLDESQRNHLAGLRAGVETFGKNPPPSGPLMPSVQGGGQSMRVFVRGNPENLGELAPAGFLRVLSSNDAALDAGTFTRLKLANELVSRNNPLTARVIVNRVWHYHFGRGIVATLSNFGKLGSQPSHPELLDTLAVRFMENGWSIKTLHREIMLSSTYRLSSFQDAANMAVDPGNEYLWRMTPRRLDFEAWRDTLLSVAGLMNSRLGGPSIDQVNPGVKEVEGFNFFSRLNGVETDNPEGRRRTLYSVVSRYAPNTTSALFDFPEPNVTSEQRIVTIVPQQQLFVLNSPFLAAMSRGLAKRLEKSARTDSDRIHLAWQLAYGRQPGALELEMGLRFLQNAAKNVPEDKLSRWEQLSHALLASNELMFLP